MRTEREKEKERRGRLWERAKDEGGKRDLIKEVYS